MSYADEMKNLVGDIKGSHRERTAYLKDLFRETQSLLEADRRELREMARELREFLAKGENARMVDFRAMMKDIQARIAAIGRRAREVRADAQGLLRQFDKEIEDMRKDVKAFLSKSETDRMADFRAMLKDIQDRVADIFRTTKGLLGEYKEERKRAAGYWAALAGKAEAAVAAPAPKARPAPAKPKPKKRKRRKKKK